LKEKGWRVIMNNRGINITLSLVMCSLTFSGIAFAHGTEMHSKMVPADAQMKKLHAIMPMFSVASAKLESAIEKGDTAEATQKLQTDKRLQSDCRKNGR
jgi:hypothetical protein